MTTLPHVYMIYDTLTDSYLRGAKGQYVFDNVGTLKRSFAHTSYLSEFAQQKWMLDNGFQYLYDNRDHAQQAFEAVGGYGMCWSSRNSCQEYLDYQKCEQAVSHCINTNDVRRVAKALKFDKQTRIIIHKMVDMKVEVVQTKPKKSK